MQPSADMLVHTGLLSDPAAIGHPLTAIRIIDATPRLIRSPETLFDSSEAGLEAFGWNFANSALTSRFKAAAPDRNLETRTSKVVAYHRSGDHGVVELSDGTSLCAPLVVGADGKGSLIRTAAGIAARETRFDEAALVCDLELQRPLGGTSVEFHYPRGPFTLVPAGSGKANLVWIDDADVLRAAKQAGADQLKAILQEKSQRLFGALTLASPSFIFPLSTLSVDHAGHDGTVLVGESAHAFPPIGAQGLNLGLRDIADLLEILASVDKTQSDWARSASQTYSEKRAGDLARTGGMVDTLFRSLLAEMLPAQSLRAGGLWALKLLPGLRRQAFSLGMGGRP